MRNWSSEHCDRSGKRRPSQLPECGGESKQSWTGPKFKRSSERIFPISDATMIKFLKRGFRQLHITIHGTARSSFRDWAAETTDFSGEVCEAALAHSIRNRVEAAYRRGDLFEKRRRL